MIELVVTKGMALLHELATCGFYVKEFLYSMWHAQKDLYVRRIVYLKCLQYLVTSLLAFEVRLNLLF